MHDQKHQNTPQPRTLLLAGRDGRIHFAAQPAHACLRKHFTGGSRAESLPRELCEWLAETGEHRRPFLRRTDETLLQASLIETDATGVVCLLLEEIPMHRDSAAASERLLTLREEEVISWVRRGKSNQEIALILNVGVNTVKKHLQNIYVKLGVNNRTAAAGF